MMFRNFSLVALAVATLAVSGCKTTGGDQPGSGLLDDRTDNTVARGIVGCYSISQATVTTDRGNPMTKLEDAKKFCAVDSRDGNGGASRSGTFNFDFYDRNNQKIGSTYGFSGSDSQPRCPGCYALSGMDGKVDWNNEQRNQPVEMKIDWTHMAAKGVFKMTKVDGGNTTGQQSISGDYQGNRFTVTLAADRSTATLKWADGESAPSFRLNPNPNPAPRCICSVYEAEGGRRLIVEKGANNALTQVTYERSQAPDTSLTGSGSYQGHSFDVTLSADKSTATMRWDDGAITPVLHYNANPNPGPRCICRVYEAEGNRVLTVETGRNNQITNVTFVRN